MVCGAFGDCKVGDLHQMKNKLNQISDHRIRQHNAIPSGILLVSQEFVLMQDNDSKHACKLCQKYIKNKEEQYVLQLMSCLVQAADLNLIELMRDEHLKSQR